MIIRFQTDFLLEESLKGKHAAVCFLCQVLYKFQGKKGEIRQDIRLYPEEIGEDVLVSKTYSYQITSLFLKEGILVKGSKRNKYSLGEKGLQLFKFYQNKLTEEEKEEFEEKMRLQAEREAREKYEASEEYQEQLRLQKEKEEQERKKREEEHKIYLEKKAKEDAEAERITKIKEQIELELEPLKKEMREALDLIDKKDKEFGDDEDKKEKLKEFADNFYKKQKQVSQERKKLEEKYFDKLSSICYKIADEKENSREKSHCPDSRTGRKSHCVLQTNQGSRGWL